jgi:hypothetical protein
MRTGYLASVPAYTPSLRILVSWSEAEDEREALARPAAPNHQEEPTCSHAPVEYGIPVLFGPHRPLRDHLARRDGTYWWSHARVRRQLHETALRLLDRWVSLRMGVVPFAICAIAQSADSEAALLCILLPPVR